MKRLMSAAVAALLAGAVFADGPAEGGRRGPGDRPGRAHMRERGAPRGAMNRPGMGGGAMLDPLLLAVQSPEIAASIGLTAEQKAKLEELSKKGAEQRELNEKVRKGMRRQMELLGAEKIDEAAVMASIDEVFEVRKAMAKDQTKRVIAIRAILTPEQVTKARQALRRFHERKDGDAPAAKPEAES